MELQMFLLWRSTSNILLNYSHIALWQYVPEAQCTWYAVEFHFLCFNLLFFNFSSFSIWKRGKWGPFFFGLGIIVLQISFFLLISPVSLAFTSNNTMIFLLLPALCIIAKSYYISVGFCFLLSRENLIRIGHSALPKLWNAAQDFFCVLGFSFVYKQNICFGCLKYIVVSKDLLWTVSNHGRYFAGMFN